MVVHWCLIKSDEHPPIPVLSVDQKHRQKLKMMELQQQQQKYLHDHPASNSGLLYAMMFDFQIQHVSEKDCLNAQMEKAYACGKLIG